MTAVLLSGAVVGGVPWPVVVLLSAIAVHPPLGGVLLAISATVATVQRDRVVGPNDEAVFLTGVAAELRGGSSLRLAIVDGAAKVPGLALSGAVRKAAAGCSIVDIAADLAASLRVNSDLMAPALSLAAESGGKAAAMVDRMAVRAVDRVEAEREHRAAAAQARASAWVVGSLPVAAVGLGLATGGIQRLVASGPIGVVVLAIGGILLALGLGAVAALSRKAVA